MQNSRTLFKGNITYTPVSYYKAVKARQICDPVKQLLGSVDLV